MSRPLHEPNERTPCFPRVSGDEPEETTSTGQELVFSPRERG